MNSRGKDKKRRKPGGESSMPSNGSIGRRRNRIKN
jgi:hypothetical protein